MRTVLLGSSSSSRKRLVASALPTGFELDPRGLSPDIDEKAIRRDDPSEMVLAIASAKADALYPLILELDPRPDFYITADQVIVANGVVREKPESTQQCLDHMCSYSSSNPAICTSGIVVVRVSDNQRASGVNIAKQYFTPIPRAVGERLIEKGDVMYCAGSFVVEDELLSPYLLRTEGEIEAVQGMPQKMTADLLESLA